MYSLIYYKSELAWLLSYWHNKSLQCTRKRLYVMHLRLLLVSINMVGWLNFAELWETNSVEFISASACLWCMAFPSTLKHQAQCLLPLWPLLGVVSFLLQSLPFLDKEPCDYTGPFQTVQVSMERPLNPNFLVCKITQSQVQGNHSVGTCLYGRGVFIT